MENNEKDEACLLNFSDLFSRVMFKMIVIEQNNTIGVNESSSQILIKFAGSLPTIRLKISAVLFLEFFAHWKDSYNNETSLKKP